MKQNSDLGLAYLTAIAGSGLLAYVATSCSGAGCVFGLLLVVGLLLVAVVAGAFALKRRVRSAQWIIRLSPVPVFVIIGICVAVIVSNVGPVQ